MIPFPIYLTSIQDNLQVGFNDFRREIALYAGWGADSSLWTNDQILELERDVQDAYRWVLYPQRLPDERVPHTWTFLEQSTTLSLTSSTWQYTLPVDFGSFVGQHMEFSADTGYAPMMRVDPGKILAARSQSTTSGKPTHFALRWTTQTAGSTQRQEVIIHPPADASYTVNYTYAVLVGKLSESNPYPVGGARIGQLMIEACKAVGEAKKNGQRGDQWNMFMASLQSAIALDKGTNTPTTLGMMRGGYGYALRRPMSSVSYYSGPDSSGNYTLVAD